MYMDFLLEHHFYGLWYTEHPKSWMSAGLLRKRVSQVILQCLIPKWFIFGFTMLLLQQRLVQANIKLRVPSSRMKWCKGTQVLTQKGISYEVHQEEGAVNWPWMRLKVHRWVVKEGLTSLILINHEPVIAAFITLTLFFYSYKNKGTYMTAA